MLLLLYGPDTYRSEEKLKEIIGKYEADIKKNKIELKRFDTTEMKFTDFQNAVEAAPLFSSKKIIVIRDFFSSKDEGLKSKIGEYLPQMAKSEDMVIFLDGEVKSNNKLFSGIKKTAKSQEFKLLGVAEVKKWMDLRIKKNNIELKVDVSIEPRAKESLANFIGSDLWLLSSELDKLILHALSKDTSGKNLITSEDVELLVKLPVKPYIFKTLDAISAKNKKEALKLLHEHLSKEENEFYIFTMFIWQIRNLVEIKGLIEEGVPVSEIARKTKIAPFAVNKNLAILRKYSWHEIKSAYEYLLELDSAVKSGKIHSKAALDMFVWRSATKTT